MYSLPLHYTTVHVLITTCITQHVLITLHELISIKLHVFTLLLHVHVYCSESECYSLHVHL